MHSGQQAKTCFSANLTAKIMQITRRTKEFVHFFALELLIRVFLRILYSNLLPIYKSNTETQRYRGKENLCTFVSVLILLIRFWLRRGKDNKNFVFCFAFHSLIRTFGFAESTFALESNNKNFVFCFAFLSLIRTFAE